MRNFVVAIVVLAIVALSMFSCAPTAVVLPDSPCTKWASCGDTTDCAALLYNRANAAMSQGRQLEKNKLHREAEFEFRKAARLMRCAEIKLALARTTNFADWQVANELELGEKIKSAIIECERRANNNMWRR